MALIIEDGSIVTGANSYVSTDDLEAYGTSRGITFSGNTEILLIQAMDYIESFDDRFKGVRVQRDQPLSWPRSGAFVEGWTWYSDEIPRQLISVQLALAVEIGDGRDPVNPASNDTLPVIEKRVEGVVGVKYANPNPPSKISKSYQSDVILRTLLRNSGLVGVRI